MSQSDTLGTLVKQAVHLVEGWQGGDNAALEGLHQVMQHILESLSQLDHSTDQWVTELEKSTSEATTALQHLVEDQTQDVDQAVALIDQVIGFLQQQYREASDISEAPSEGSDVSANAPAVETATEEATGYLIPEEDIPLILDFIAESSEHIEAAEAGLLELEKNPQDGEVINLIFRSFHTIKGMAGFLNLHEIGGLAHTAENLLSKARKGELTLQGTGMDVVFASVDMMKKMIATLKGCVNSGSPLSAHAGVDALLEQLKACLEGTTDAPAILPKSEPEPEPEPSLEQDRQLDTLLTPEAPKAQVKSERNKSVAADDKIKVSISRLDSMIDMAGELVIANLMVSEQVKDQLSSEHDLGCKVSHLGKIVREIQELSMAMRMVPIQGVFQKMTRLVRDLARKSDKDIKLVTQGEDTELDRTVVDKIADPLVHMIRNSIDHGIEPPQERQEAGKEPAGCVHLRAFHQAGSIVIEIEDNGRGLNKERILQKAIDNGVVDPNQDLSDEEIYKLIFHAGLSTAAKVTDISGRGVGMDVVRKNIEALRGKIEIKSVVGQGTTFTIRMPLTLAIIDGQIVRVGQERFIVPINSIIQSLRPTGQQVSSVQGKAEMVAVRGTLLPLVRLDRLFGVSCDTDDVTQSLVMVVEDEGRQCCLLVDDLLGQQQVVIKSLGQALGSVAGVSGGAIMGNGNVSLILDVPGLIDLAKNA